MDINTIIWKRVDLIRRNWERKYFLVFRRVLNSYMVDIAGRVTADNVMNADILVEGITGEEIEKAMIDLYVTIGSQFAADTRSQFAKSEEDLIDQWRAYMTGYVRNVAGEKIVSITGDTKRQALLIIRRVLEREVADNRGIDVIARSIRKALTTDGVAMNQYRALRIARTEVVGASNVGSLEGAKSLNMPMKKSWLATRDGRARDTHLAADGQTVMLEEQFNINGNMMDIPGGQGPAEEVINCRCSVTYKVLR